MTRQAGTIEKHGGGGSMTKFVYYRRELVRSGPKSDGTWYVYGSNDGSTWVLAWDYPA